MNILSWFNPGRWLMLLGVIGALTLGYFAFTAHHQGIGEARATVKYNDMLTKQKAEAIVLLDAEKTKVAKAEKALADFKNQQEIKDVANAKTVATLNGKLRDLGRLRDPHATGCRPSSAAPEGGASTSASNSADNATETGGLLSEPLTRLFQRITVEADEINVAYISCRADVLNTRQELAKLRDPK